MSWSIKRVFGLVAGAAVLSAALVGCAGDAHVGPDPGVPTIPANGGLDQARATSNSTVGAQPQPQVISVTTQGGDVVDAWLPGGVAVTAGEEVALFDQGEAIIDGLTVASRQNQPGDILVQRLPNGTQHLSGVRVNTQGRLTGRFVLPNGRWLVSVIGPMSITRGGQRLDIQSLLLEGVVRNGVASIPTDRHDQGHRGLTGDFPINGGTTWSLRLTAWLPTQFAGGHTRLLVTHANGTLVHNSRVNANGRAIFGDSQLGENSRIPLTGVNTVHFTYSDEVLD